MNYPFDPTGLAFWLIWGAVGGAVELIMAFSGHTSKTLSYQVWSFAARSPAWVRNVFIGGLGLAVTTLVVHFFGRF